MLEALADLMENKFEVKSGENALNRIDHYNETIEPEEPECEYKFASPGTISETEIPEGGQNVKFSVESPVSEEVTDTSLADEDEVITAAGDCYEEEIVFVGSDVSALHPSCTAKMAGEAMRKAVLKTQLELGEWTTGSSPSMSPSTAAGSLLSICG